MSKLPDVQVGQVWRDMDKRMSGRKLRVVRIEGEKAIMENVLCDKLRTKVSIRRMRPGSTGYERVR